MVAARTPLTAAATPLSVAYVDDGATLLTSPGMAPLRVHDLPDLDGARRWLRLMHRIDRCELEVTPGGLRAELIGVGHRLPVRRVVPVRIALGLFHLGVPTSVVGAGC